MTTSGFIERLQGLSIEMWAEGGLLRVRAPKGVLTPALTSELASRKADILALLSEREPAVRRPPLKARARQGDVPLSFNQLRLWLLDQMEPGKAHYNIPTALHLQGPLDIPALRASIDSAVERHEALRTSFRAEKGEPVQVIAQLPAMPLPVIDLRALPGERMTAESWRLAAEEAQQPFDLSSPPLLRLTLLHRGTDDYYLLLTIHHIITDGWSMVVLTREIASAYAAFSTGRPSPLPPLPLQYADFAYWQRDWLQGKALELQLDYWQRLLAGSPPLLEMPTDRPRPAVLSYRGAVETALLSRELSASVKAFAQRHGVTLFVTLAAAFNSLLLRYTGREDLVTGIPIAYRHWREVEELIGLFANTLVLRLDLSGEPTFRELLARVQRRLAGNFDHQDLPFEKLVEELHPERSLSYSPVFQVVFGVENYPQEELRARDLSFRPLTVHSGSAKFDLAFLINGSTDALVLALEHSTDLFDRSTILRLVRHFETLLAAAVANPDRGLLELPILGEPESLQILREWNDTAQSPRPGTRIHHLFEDQAERSPQALAVAFEGSGISYAELNARASRLARHLARSGVAAGSLVAVYLDRSPEMIVALLAVLKAGAAYVPLDSSYPDQRILWILSSLSIRHLLTQGSKLAALSRTVPQTALTGITWLDQEDAPESGSLPGVRCWSRDRFEHLPGTNLGHGARPDDLAYVIFTSGTTGTPKGVMVCHQPVVNLIEWVNRTFGIRSSDRVLFLTSLCFDLSVYDIFGILAAGGSIRVASDADVQDPERLLRLLLTEPITFWDSAPAALQQLAPLFPCAPQPGSGHLRLVFLSGDWIPLKLPDQTRAAFPQAKVISLGGATEATVWSNFYPIEDVHPAWTSIPYGRPITNARYHVLNRSLHPSPCRVPGDLYIGGDCLSTGYLDDPCLTCEKYIPDPFSDRPGDRLYRTGDRARYWSDGTIEFLGRLDHQVKIRGFRIELGEIESVLAGHPEVREAVVLSRKAGMGDQRLAGYVVPRPGTAASTAELRQFLRERLPEYMVPATLMTLQSMPVTANGKLDRKALLTMTAPEPSGATEPVAPRNPIEEVLAEIWRQVLAVPRVGVQDDFFLLGGHSILATQLMFRVRQAFGVDLPLRTLFEAPTVAALAAALAGRNGAGFNDDRELPKIEPAPAARHLPFPLTDIQEAYWIGRSGALELGSVATHAYFEVDAGGLDPARLERAVQRLIERHDMLRAVVLADGLQQVLPAVPAYRIRVIDLREVEGAGERSGLETVRDHLSHQVLPSDRWPLFEIVASRLAGGRLRLHVSFDLLIGDAWSFRILDRELARLYRDPEAELPPLELSFRDYVLAELRLRESAPYRQALAYWEGRLADLPPAPALPLAVDPSRLTSPRFVRREARLEPPAWERLRERAAWAALSPSSLLLAAYAEVLGAWSASPRFTINLTLFHRLPLHPQVHHIVGDFTSLTLLAVEQGPGETFEERAKRLQTRLWDDLDHNLVSGVRVLRELRERLRAEGETAPRMPIVFTSTLNQTMGDEGESFFDAAGDETGYGITQTPQVWLDHQVFETAGALAWNWDAVEQLFPAGMLDDMFAAYCRLLERLAGEEAAWNGPVLRLLPDWQLRLIAEANATGAPEPAGLLHEPFLEQACRAPEAVAVITSDRRISYRDLERGSLVLAHRLRERGARPNRLVAVVMEKGWEQVVSTLAVLRAGGAYLPVDPHLPAERLRDLLEQGEVETALTQPRHAGRIEWPAGVDLVKVDETIFEAPEEPLLLPRQSPGDLAYVIFTSGSTGRPKGVMIDHRGALNTVIDINRRFAIEPRDRVLALSSLSFDLSVYDVFGTLAAGGGIVVPDAEARRDPAHWAQLAARESVTVWNSVPALMEMLLELGPDPLPPSLRLVLLSGDWIPVSLPERIRTAVPGAAVVSLGGATEASIWSILYPIAQVAPDWVSIPYGKPMLNQTFRVLDEGLEPCPVWVQGQLYIGGLGLARGYWRDEEKTRAAFVIHPQTGERLYRTGDLGRLLPDGNIEFLGRDDTQVKIRGYRVELGEIEATLLRHPDVRTVAVLALDDGTRDRRLVACVVPQGDAGEPQRLAAELRSHAARTLPDWMVPSGWKVLESLPLTSNGKVDRRALAQIELEQRPRQARRHVAPREGLEQSLAAIWAEVLGTEAIGAEDDFFALGGHSLLAARALSRIRNTLGVEIPLRTLFEVPTLADLAACIAATQQGAEAAAPPLLRPVPRDGHLPLSFAQRRLWFLDQLEPGSAAYNIPAALRLVGRLDLDALAGSLSEIVRRHEALRTTFIAVDGRPVQVIHQDVRGSLPVVDLRGLPGPWIPAESRRLLQVEAARPFDLAHGPLLHTLLIATGGDEHLTLLNLHHIVGDAWSLDVLVRELSTLYQAFTARRPSPLPELEIQYADFAVWQNRRFAGLALETEIAYWRPRLESAPALELPTDRPRPAVQSFRGATSRFTWARLSSRLQALSVSRGVTPFMTLLAGFGALLLRHSGQRDLIVGSPIANRQHLQVERLIGFFLNTLALRLDLSGDPGFLELLARVRETTLGAYAHQELPFERLVEEIQPERSLSRTPLFQVMLVLHNNPGATLRFPGLDAERLDVDSGTAKIDLTLFLMEDGSDIWGSWEFNRDLFEMPTVLRLTAHLGQLLEAALSRPELRLSELPLLGEGERAQLLTEWNDTRIAIEEDASLVDLFDGQVARTPQATALIFGDERLSYAELSSKANRLAHGLRRLGVERGTPVGICLKRSPEMAICVLGVLKAGGACLPLDPAYPAERLGFMLTDASAPLVLTRGDLVDLLPMQYREAVRLVDQVLAGHGGEEPPAPRPTGQDLAYLIYTSGSTGRPKGVAMPHGALRTLMGWQRQRSEASPRTLQLAPLSFDVSFQEMFSTWSAGGTLVLIPEELRRNPPALLDLLARSRVQRLFLPFVALRQLAEAAEQSAAVLPDLREIITAGEQLQVSGVLVSWLGRLPDCSLDNQYGPSETHVVTAFRMVGAPESWPALPPIGRPIAGSEIYALDPDFQPVPAGVPGELYLGGVGVARGYLGRPALTAERFVPDPFSGRSGARLYRTGDRVGWRRDGQMEFLGRVDHQVKVRGFRVEPGEIEVVLQEHPQVHQAVVLAQAGPAGGELRAWVVPEPGARLTAGELRDFLRDRLPDYMVPARFALLTDLPMTPSGKVDRLCLGQQVEWEEETAYTAPSGPVEELLAAMFSRLLARDRVGAEDHFFRLGGHSLLAVQLAARAQAAFGVDLPLRVVFEKPAVRDLARFIEEAMGAGERRIAAPLEAVARDTPLPASFAQQRLWFLDQLDPDNAVYNLPWAIRVEGSLEPGVLRAALAEIVRRHEVLRTTFAEKEGEPVQLIAPGAPFPFPEVDLSGLPSPRRRPEATRLALQEAARPFDLGCGPLQRSALLTLGEAETVVLLTMHHIISDGWSIGVLVRELEALYPRFRDGLPSPLPELPIQYADFAAWQRQWLAGDTLREQLASWRDRLQGAPPVLELPLDRPRPAVPTFRGDRRSIELDAELATQLREASHQADMTLFMTLLAAFQIVLQRSTGQDDFTVGTSVAGRAQLQTEDLIGIFVNTLVLRADLTGKPEVGELLDRVREVAFAAFAAQDLPFEKLVAELQPERSLSHSPLFQVMLVLQNAPAALPQLPGLTAELLPQPGTTTRFDLTLVLDEVPSGLLATFEYNCDLFDASTIARMERHFFATLRAWGGDPARRALELPLLAEWEQAQVLTEWNDTACEPLWEGPAHGFFDLWAAQSPTLDALLFEGRTVSYGELRERADRLASYLSARGIGPEARVALCLEPSPEMIVGLLGVLKAGAAYVPLDPGQPQERLSFLLADAAAAVLLTQERLRPRLSALGCDLLCLDSQWQEVASATPSGLAAVAPETVAYVIYTSGSTGLPKGVVAPHLGLASFTRAMARTLGLSPGDRVLQFASLSFDASAVQIFPTLASGATLVLHPDPRSLSTAELSALCVRAGVTLLDLPAALWRQWVADTNRSAAAIEAPIRLYLTGGESVPADVLRDWARVVQPGSGFLSSYGPTEATVTTTAFRTGREQVEQLSSPELPLGAPLDNVRLYLLDGQLTPVAIGVPGEVYIGGAGVTRGYLNAPAATAERYLPDPWADRSGARMYRTGDLARRLPGGGLCFLGRRDFQVKLRGHRVELGEIEAALGRRPGVRDKAVLLREEAPGDRRLVAFVVPEWPEELSPEALQEDLRRELPAFMVPWRIVPLPALPLTAGGKVDRAALTRMAPAQSTREDSGPSRFDHPLQELLAGLWAEVLGLSGIRPQDDFFALGGHSLLATQVVSRLRAVFGLDLPLRTLFEAPTLAGLAQRLESGMRTAAGLQPPPIGRASRSGPQPLSFAQQRLWFLYHLDPASPVYNMPIEVHFAGDLDLPVLERSLGEVVRRHESLRTVFRQETGEGAAGGAVQVILPAAAAPIPVVDLGGLPEASRGREARHLAQREAGRPFDLARGPLLRLCILRLGRTVHTLLGTMHHIISDGWSIQILERELSTLYAAFRQGRLSPLTELPIQYTDFAVWQRGWLTGEVLASQVAFWRERLAGAPALLTLPTDRPRPPVRGYRGAGRPVTLPERLAVALKTLGRREGTTLFMTVLAAYQALLARYSGQTDVCVGTPVAGRNHLEIESLIGFFVNTLVLRADLSGSPSFRDLLGQVRRTVVEAQMHQDLPFEKLVEELQPERSSGHSPLFQVTFTLHDAATLPHRASGFSEPGLSASIGAGAHTGTVMFDLLLLLADTPAGLLGSLDYSMDLFDETTVDRMGRHLCALLGEVAGGPDRSLPDLSLLSAGERWQLLGEWNDTAVSYERDLCLPDLVRAQADQRPQAVAVSWEQGEMTYAELVDQAGRLTRRLKRLDVDTEAAVALLAERSPGLIVSLLAITGAGGAYLPLDPGYPAERLAFMLEDAGAEILLAERHLLEGLPEPVRARLRHVVCLDEESMDEEAAPGPVGGPLPDSLAYIMYTSGSTGRPKGVAVTHRNVVRLVRHSSFARLGPPEVFLQLAPVSFDASTLEIWGPLANGGRLVLAPPGLLSFAELGRTISQQGVTSLWLTAGLFHQIVDEQEGSLPEVRQLLAGGDVLSPDHVRRALASLPGCRIINGYGPTEGTTFTCCHALERPGDVELSVPIGRPISNTRAYVLDGDLHPLPTGVYGELYAGGDGVARGYHGRPELTAERFVPDPFGTAGSRLYRTGDIARFLPAGTIEFQGRIDHQVKIRGFRIELGEIESALRRHPVVQDAVVLARGDTSGSKHLVAYVVSSGSEASALELRDFLQEILPEYMVPSLFVSLPALPLTPQGKVDRRSLPEPGARSDLSGARQQVAPRNAFEQVLAGIWSDVLGSSEIGVDDDFFDLGGHSLLAIQLVSQVGEVFGVELGVWEVFEASTVSKLATRIQEQMARQLGREDLERLEVAAGTGSPESR